MRILEVTAVLVRKCRHIMKTWYDTGFCRNTAKKVEHKGVSIMFSEVFFVVMEYLPGLREHRSDYENG